MADETISSWDGEEGNGGLFDHGRVTISDETCFGYDPNYMNGEQACFILIGTTDNEDFPEVKQLYSIGKGWEVDGDGESVSGRATFLTSTNYWALVLSAVEHGLGDTLKSRGEAYEAKVWHGLTVDMKRVEYSLPGMVLREGQRPLNRVVITGVAGVGKTAAKGAGAGKGAKAAAKPAPAEEAADETPAPAASAGGGSALTPKLRIALTKLAKEHADHDDFMAAALDLDGVSGNEAAEDAVSDSSPSSLWAKARG